METGLVAEALKFMLLGMGIVFVFLYAMILILQYQAKLVAKYFPEKPKPVDSPKVNSTETNKKKKVAAAIAAIAHHKSGN